MIYWIVTVEDTGHVYKSAVRDDAEVVFKENMKYGHEVRMDRKNADGSVDLIKRYSGAFTVRNKP